MTARTAPDAPPPAAKAKLLRIGELSKATGKTVRAVHLYEELGLLRPATRTEGGFRLYEPDAVARIRWVVKLQAIGFKLSEIQGFVRAFECAPSGRKATDRARQVFATKLDDIRAQIAQLRTIEDELIESLEYLSACQDCPTAFAPTECSHCEHQGHERGRVPPLFANLSRTAAEESAATPAKPQAQASPATPATTIDVPISELKKGDVAARGDSSDE